MEARQLADEKPFHQALEKIEHLIKNLQSSVTRSMSHGDLEVYIEDEQREISGQQLLKNLNLSRDNLLIPAEAVLRLRSLFASGDLEEYWSFHRDQEFERNHAHKYKKNVVLGRNALKLVK